MFLIFHLGVFQLLVLISKVASDLAVLHAEDKLHPEKSLDKCLAYNPSFHTLPEILVHKDSYNLADFSVSYGCSDIYQAHSIQNDVVAVKRGNCTFVEKLVFIQKHEGKMAIFVTDDKPFSPGANQSSDYDEINITTAMITLEDFKDIQALGKKIVVWAYAPDPPMEDYNSIAVWLLAVGCVAGGAYWAGMTISARMEKKRRPPGADGASHDESDEESDEPETVPVTPMVIIIFVGVMCGVLLLLYFLYDYLVYFMIAIFCLAGSTSLYHCLVPWWKKLPPHCRLPANRIPCCSDRPEIKNILLLLVCLGIGIFWGIERNASYAWIVQDILGVTFCIYAIKTIRLPSLKVCFILLVLLLFYDVFFVFITPLFTKSGQSVMVDVATGGGSSSGETLPMVFKMPRFRHSLLSICHQYSLLGFGDVIIPGLLVSYCHMFDVKSQHKHKIYYITCTVAYGIGLLITFAALYLMKSGQPALLYLVPCTLVTTLLLAVKRGELGLLWRGEINIDESKVTVQEPDSNNTAISTMPDTEYNDNNDSTTTDVAVHSNVHETPSQSDHLAVSHQTWDTSSESSMDGEKRQLLINN